MKIATIFVCLAWLTPGLLLAQEARVAEVMSKDLSNIPGKQGVMLTVEYPPGSSDPVHRHNAWVYIRAGRLDRDAGEGWKGSDFDAGSEFLRRA